MTSNKLPNLFIVGAPKCGTTAWAEYLGSHPDIFFPQHKDQCYFALDLPNFRLIRTAADYAAQYAGSGNSRLVGDASAMYLYSTAAAAAIYAHDPSARILIFLRDQEEYLPSLHNQFLLEFAEEIEDFETAWRLSGNRPPETIPAGCLEPRTLDYNAMGRFDEQVGRYLALFPADQVRVIRFAEWTTDPRRTYLDLLSFLGLEDDGRIDFPPVNPGATYRSRRLARWIKHPSPPARSVARAVRSLPLGGLLDRMARRIGYSAAPGYRTAISPALRDEIKRHYAKDNLALNARTTALRD
jgi:hypothetical protein